MTERTTIERWMKRISGDLTGAERRTFLVDTVRQGLDGLMMTLIQTVFLLVAIRYFHVPDSLKSLLSAAHYIGFMGALFYTSALATSRYRKSVLAAVPVCLSGTLLFASGFTTSGTAFIIFVTLAVVIHSLGRPFTLGIYQENYHPGRRGRLLAAGMMLSILVGIGANSVSGKLLDRDLSLYGPIHLVAGAALFLGGCLFLLIPSKPPARKEERNPLRALSVLFSDTRFGVIMLSWFIFGFANLWSTPIRMVYLAEPERGLGLSPLIVLIIMGIIPEIVKLLSTPVWAYYFDKMNFVILRALMCGILGTGILLFFLTANIAVITIASILLNIGFSGTKMVWDIWITKIAPPGKTQAYMSVHTFLGGVRGILGPYLGFLFIGYFSIREMGYFSFFLTVVSILILVPYFRETSPAKAGSVAEGR